MKENHELVAFNRGLISPLALARVDVKRVGLSAEVQDNWMPRTLGPMSLRPGLQYLGTTYNNAKAFNIPFVFNNNDAAVVELTDYNMRVWVNDVVVTRPAVGTVLANPTFVTDLSSWTSADEGSTTLSSWRAGGYLALLGDGTNAAIRYQVLTIANADQNVQQALRIVVVQGPCLLRVGVSQGDDTYISETTLQPGTHSLAFTPTGAAVYVQLFARGTYATLVDSCAVESAGVMVIPTPYPVASLPTIQYDQSGDVIFVVQSTLRSTRIERRGPYSWSIVNFVADDGPFLLPNTGPTTLTPSAITGEITLTASKAMFYTGHVGALFQLTSTGQSVTQALGAANVYTNPVQVTGLTATRAININISGVWTATVTLQRSVGAVGSWVDVASYTTNQAIVYNDTFDNQIIFYRLGIKAGNYTSGTATAAISYPFGSITGALRVVSVTSSTLVSGTVVAPLGATTATPTWAEGAWSTHRGFPSALVFDDGRLWFAGKDKLWGSVSDAYTSFDPNHIGDAGPVSRSIGQGPVDVISWLASTVRLLMGAQTAEKLIGTSLGDPITPTNFNMRNVSTYGSATMMAMVLDRSVMFVDRTSTRLMEAEIAQFYSTVSTTELTTIVPELCAAGIVRTALQRRYDTRVHCVLANGTVAVLIFDKNENVQCWVTVSTAGFVEDVVVLPSPANALEDIVYYTVRRTINGLTVRYHERWALISECVGGAVNKQADAFYYWTGASSSTITGLNHLIGQWVVCWANSKDLGSYFVSNAGSITLSEPTTAAIVGIGYTANYTSSKLAYAARGGSALNQTKRVNHVGFVLSNTHAQGLLYGVDPAHLDNLPAEEDGAAVDTNYLWTEYDNNTFTINGTYDPDARVYLRATAPRPCTVMAAVLGIKTNEDL